MKKIFIFFLAIVISCNKDEIQEGPQYSDSFIEMNPGQPGQVLSRNGTNTEWITIGDGSDATIIAGTGVDISKLESRSPEYCVCEFISIDFPVISGLTNFVFTWNPLYIPRTQFYWKIYRWQKINNVWQWSGPVVTGAWNFLNDNCIEKSNAPRHLFGSVSNMCDGHTYRIDAEMWVTPEPSDPNYPNYVYCSELSETFIYTTPYKPAGCIAVR